MLVTEVEQWSKVIWEHLSGLQLVVYARKTAAAYFGWQVFNLKPNEYYRSCRGMRWSLVEKKKFDFGQFSLRLAGQSNCCSNLFQTDLQS